MATAQPTPTEREYETIYVLRPDVDPDTADRVAGRVTEVVAREHGRLVKVENWGRRRLAYEVKKQKRGVYYYLKYIGGGSLISELERNLRMLDGVMKFQTVLLRDEIAADTLQIDPEDVKFARLEPMAEDEKEESPERALGLVEPEAPPPRPEGEFGEDEDGDEWVEPRRRMSEAPPSSGGGGGAAGSGAASGGAASGGAASGGAAGGGAAGGGAAGGADGAGGEEA